MASWTNKTRLEDINGSIFQFFVFSYKEEDLLLPNFSCLNEL